MFDIGKFVGPISDLGKIPTKVVLFFGLSSGALLLLPETWLRKLRLEKLAAEFGQWIGIVFLLSAVLLLLNLSAWVYRTWKTTRKQKYLKAKVIAALKELDDAEKAVLREFFIQGQNTVRMPMDEPVVAGLISKGILRPVGSVGERALAGIVFPFVPSEMARPNVTLTLVDLPEQL